MRAVHMYHKILNSTQVFQVLKFLVASTSVQTYAFPFMRAFSCTPFKVASTNLE